MAESLLTSEETQVYMLSKFEQITDIAEIAKQLGTDSQRVQKILDEIDKKAKVATSPRVLHTLVSHYRRILEIAKDYYIEKKEGMQHVFSIDFSDLFVYLNPQKAFTGENSGRLWDQTNVGSIYYMFNSKREDHEYCLLPPAAWELLHHVYESYRKVKNADFDSFIESRKGKKIKRFHKSIQDIDKNKCNLLVEKLMSSYRGTGGLIDILNMAQQNSLDARFDKTIVTIQKMTEGKNKKIQPINKEDAKHVKIDEKTYRQTLSSLSYYRPAQSINNKVDALNLALTYDLTRIKENAFCRLVSHSKQPTKAFRLVDYNKKWISCCPQCVSALISFEDKLEDVDENGQDIIKFQGHSIDDTIERLRRIGRNCFDLQYVRRFALYSYLNEYSGKNSAFMQDVYNPVQEYFSDLVKFKQQIYKPFIKPIMNINAGKGVDRTGCFDEDQAFLNNLLERETYKKMVEEASAIIFENVRKTRNFLDKFVNENHEFLMPEMKDLIKNIDNDTAREPTQNRNTT